MQPPIQRFFPGQRLTTSEMNKIAAGINAVRVPRGDETISVDQTAGAISVRDDRPPLTPDQTVFLKILATKPDSTYEDLGGGLYYAKIYTQAQTIVVDQSKSTLSLDSPAPDQVTCIYLNPQEIGQSGHAISSDSWSTAYFVGFTQSGWPLYTGSRGGGSTGCGLVTYATATEALYKVKKYDSGGGTISSPGTLSSTENAYFWNLDELDGNSNTGWDILEDPNTNAYSPAWYGEFCGTNPDDNLPIYRGTVEYVGCKPPDACGTITSGGDSWTVDHGFIISGTEIGSCS